MLEDHLRPRLEAIQELKREYGIGSKEAFLYLKVCDDYERLRDQLATQLRVEGFHFRPTLRQTSNLCDYAQKAVCNAVEVFALSKALERGNTFTNKPIHVHPYSPHFREYDEITDDALVDFAFDYAPFLLDYGKYMSSTNNSDKALFYALANSISSDRPCLTLTTTEKKMSFADLEKCSDPLIQEDFFYDLKNERSIEDKNLEHSFVKEFDAWIDDDKENAYYPRYSKYLTDLERATEEEVVFLYGDRDNPYERAVEENTLRRIETERRIALHYILRNSHDQHSPHQMISTLLTALEGEIRVSRERFKTLQVLTAPPIVLDNERNILGHLRYELVAIKKNRAWLENVLSH